MASMTLIDWGSLCQRPPARLCDALRTRADAHGIRLDRRSAHPEKTHRRRHTCRATVERCPCCTPLELWIPRPRTLGGPTATHPGRHKPGPGCCASAPRLARDEALICTGRL